VTAPSLTEAEAGTLAAVLDRLIPPDDNGPGAVEAGVLDFIDRELAGALKHQHGDYVAGLAELDALAEARHGKPFAALDAGAQDAVLREAESGSLRPWFEMVLGDCVDGLLSDPSYGGNRDFAGWRLVGYPGPSLVWTEQDQELDRQVPFRGTTLAARHD
jgi:gluconate 2-dehydrogenase gamma chain